MIFLYRLLYLLLKTFVVVLSPILNAKSKKWVQLRGTIYGSQFRDLQLQESIWIHASSGEIEYAKSLIRDLKKKAPQFSIVVTYSSESAEKLFENVRPWVDHFIPLPWDDQAAHSYFIQKIKPKLLIFSRTDLWPEMIEQCHRRQIPMGLISYFPQMNGLNRFLLKFLLRKLDFISCVDGEIEKQIAPLLQSAKTKLRVDGDTRFDQVFARLEQTSKLEIQSPQKIFTFGSIWTEDENQLKALWLKVLENQQKLILSPHDVSEARIDEICQWLQQNKVSYHRISSLSSTILFDFQVLVIDQIGVLADAYRFSDFAFVGGSFKTRVHSVMEPLACGLPVFVGPFIQNSPEAIKYSQTFVHVCQNEKELISKYLEIHAASIIGLKLKIKTEIQKNQGASKKLADFITNSFLKKANS